MGLGIGATPFISILRDLLNNTRAADYQTVHITAKILPFELASFTSQILIDFHMLMAQDYTETSRSDDSSTSCASSTGAPSSKRRTQRTTNAHFYWVTREPGSFEWFKGVMDEVADMDHKVKCTKFQLVFVLLNSR